MILLRGKGGLNIQGENDAYDFGTGAGFYVDATKAPYNAGYNMYTYITEELPKTVFAAFPQLDDGRISITGHSMGGHGALTCVCFPSIFPVLFSQHKLELNADGGQFLRNPGKYKSVSAFAPISNPINCPWGQKAFTGYFGDDDQSKAKWKEHDASELIKKWPSGPLDVLIDVVRSYSFPFTSPLPQETPKTRGTMC